MSDSPLERSRVFDHEAMNTSFALRLCESDEATAKSVAAESFYLLDQLEGQLSRFIDGSDVSRINAMKAGETLYLSESCHQCLLQSMQACVETHGLFDITLGKRIEHRKSGADGDLPELVGKLSVHPDVAAITCDEAGRQIDLGGAGKGFALDQIRQILVDWNIESGLISAGASSLLAVGSEAWPIELKGDQETLRLELLGQSMSASGIGMQGSHIIHPWGESAMPKNPCQRVWVIADQAVVAEAWSTALMLVDPEDVPEATADCDKSMRVFADRDGSVMCLK